VRIQHAAGEPGSTRKDALGLGHEVGALVGIDRRGTGIALVTLVGRADQQLVVPR
jgi:hypothetical protein